MKGPVLWISVASGLFLVAGGAAVAGPALLARTSSPGGSGAAPVAPAYGGVTVLLTVLLVVALAVVVVLATGWYRAHTQVRQVTATLRATSDELAAEEGFLTDVLNAVDIAIVVTDAQGRLVIGNRAAVALAAEGGWAPGLPGEADAPVRILGSDGREPLAGQDQPTLRALRGEIIRDCELVIEPIAGESRRTLMVNAQPLRDDSGAIIGTVSAGYDITALREYQAELASFAGTAAHDLKSPLSAVVGYAERLTDTINDHLTGEPLHEAQHAATRLVAAANRMHQLINDLLAYTTSRDAALTLIPVDLRALIDEVITTCTDDWQTEAADGERGKPVIFVEPLPVVEADRTLLRQVIDNLIGNAMKYTAPGELPKITITAKAQRDGWIQVQIADRGIGIPDGQHNRIFDNFHRADPAARYTGTGLGLAICRHAIQRHGGKITASDNPGGGTVFRFTLPIAHNPPATSYPTAPTHYVWIGRRLDTTDVPTPEPDLETEPEPKPEPDLETELELEAELETAEEPIAPTGR